MLKRSAFKRKPTVPLKRTPLKAKTTLKTKSTIARKSKSDTKKIQDKLWQECRRITMSRYKEPHTCFTCHKPISGSNRQLGHFISNSVGGALLRYNLDNLRLQCYYCNINASGNWVEYYKNLVLENGQEYVDNLIALKYQTLNKPASDYYKELLEQYKNIA